MCVYESIQVKLEAATIHLFYKFCGGTTILQFDKMLPIETRWDPIHGYDYTYWPDSKYFRNYRFSPPITVTDDWSFRSRVWFPYYWSTRRLFNHYMDYKPSEVSIRDVRLRNNLYF